MKTFSETYQSLKWKAVLKMPVTVFLEEPMLFVFPLKGNLSEKAFSCVKEKTISNFEVKLAERSSHSFSVYLMNQIFQTSVLLNM